MRLPGTVAREGWELWMDLSIFTRRRLALVAGVLGVVAVILLVAVPALPCQAPGGDACPPSDDAIGLVPGDALTYAHLNIDPSGGQFEAARGLGSRVPALAQQATGRLLSGLPGPDGATVDFGRDIARWVGDEAALAILPAGGRAAQEVQLLEANDEDGALEFADSIASGSARASSYRGVQVRVDGRGLATALTDGFLAIGTTRGVREVIDAQSGADGTSSLADDAAASLARDALPDQRLADAYLSEDGVAKLVANRGAPLAAFGSVINPGASRGVVAALVASDDGLDLNIRSTLDPERVPAHPGFFSAFPSFEPTLPASLPPESLGYLGIGDPGKAISSLLEQASVEEPGLAAAVAELTKRVQALGEVDIQRDLLPSLGGEAAIAVTTAGGGEGGPPVLTFVGAGVDDARASEALARLQGPVAEALDSSRQAPVFSEHQVGDVTASSLRLTPAVDLTYAVADSTLVIASDPAGVKAVSAGGPGLDDADLFRQATGGLPEEVSMLGYLNLDGLIGLAERAGLATDPAYRAFAAELGRLEALGLAVQSSPELLSVDVRLIVG